MIHSTDLHGKGGFLSAHFTSPGLEGTFVPPVERDCMTGRCELSQHAGQIYQARALSGGSVHGHDRDLFVRQNLLDESGQTAAGSDLDEGSDAVVEHGPHTLYEVHG